MQKLSVLAVWLVAFCAVLRGHWRRPSRTSPSLAAGGRDAARGVRALRRARDRRARCVLERYAAIDPSFRLIRDARTMRSAETARVLRVPALADARAAAARPPGRYRFRSPLKPAEGRKPHVFCSSSTACGATTFGVQPGRDVHAGDRRSSRPTASSFKRAFTRYSGTGISVPSIWAGGMIIHVVQQPAFGRRNTLMKLVEANDFPDDDRRQHRRGLLSPATRSCGGSAEKIGKTEFDACRTLGELERALDARGPDAGPAFFYALPQNAHIATAAMRTMPPGETYPGFFDKVAAGVHEVDTCLGRFVGFLKRAHLYDDSVIIVTSDHGDSLGEEGRWGHAYFLYPEVMRVPLIVHLPSWLKARVKTDVDAVAFSTDITPTLYALLGYEPRDLGSALRKAVVRDPAADPSSRRRESFLVASSYGAVYGMLRDNGQSMYVVDAVDGREYAFDLASVPGARMEVTQTMTNENRRMIQEQLTALAALYQYQPNGRDVDALRVRAAWSHRDGLGARRRSCTSPC